MNDMQAFYIGQHEDFGEEVEATVKNKRFMKLLNERRARSKDQPRVSQAEVKRQLGLKK